MPRLLPLAMALGFFLAGRSGLAAERIDYLRDVKPLLAARCYTCHGGLQQKSGLRVDTARLLRDGGSSGPAIVPGRSDDSLLIAHVTARKGALRMPPASEGEGLLKKQIALLKEWIDQGATGPTDEKPEADPRDHWAFRAPVRPPLPAVKGGRMSNPVDAFLTAEREKRGLVAQSAADRRTLLRRVYLDLIGLPPTHEEQAAFLADDSADAFEKVVDRLLASKHYGERWGRHWMDVWRYSDWWGLGAEVRNSQKHVWHWRDWIVESLNADRGYDHMLREMLAADELYPNDLDKLRATGFLVRSYFIFNRNTWLEEVVEHTSKAFLGLTVNCAKCHDHKYDPIAQVDYYRLRAFFEPYQVRTEEVPGEVDFQKDGIPRVFDCNLEAPTYRFVRGDEKRPLKDKPLSPGLPPLLALGNLEVRPVPLPPEAHSPGLRPFVLEDHLRTAQKQVKAAGETLAQARKALAEAEARAPQVAAPMPSTPAAPMMPGIIATPLVRDDFARPQPEVWEVGEGQWKHEGGKLVQQREGEMRSVLRWKKQPPADFQARFRFSITGGEPWRSVGLCFDTAGDNETLVYASAYAGGPKVQIAYKQGGAYVYPPEGMQARPIGLNEPVELMVQVRGPLLNVAVNGEPALAYRLPIPRRPGSVQLITYAAKAEFLRFELGALPAGVALAEARGAAANSKEKPLTVEQARLAVQAAEKALAAAAAEGPSLQARAAADRARQQQPPAPGSRDLAKQAARAEKQVAVFRAEEALARTEMELLRAEGNARAPAEQKRNAAREALARERKALESPGETFTPLRGALKAQENNLETEASRQKPFPTTSTGRRTALAKWLTDSRHPLTARVAVNHVWARHFGKPLVPTVFDFGRKGTPPTHPALLDFLAIELMEHGWSLKHLHRLLVTSQAYRLSSSAAGAVANSGDPENRYYWRMNPMRMEAQVVRDSLLHLAGELDPTMGGPSLDPVQQESSRRRSLYFVHSHNDHHKFLSLFDDASVLECYRRTESIVPQQALALSNSKFALEMADRINDRLHARLGIVPDAAFVRAAFEQVLSASPTPAEQAECEKALAELTKVLQKQGIPNSARRARGDLVHALVNHNDFITIR